MRDVAIVAFAETPILEAAPATDEVEMVRSVVNQALAQVGLDRREIGFFCSGSCDYVQGVPFSFVAAVDALGAWPPIEESHVEMDGAWALYEAYVRLQHGDIDTAVVFAFGRPSLGDPADVFSQQLDPYTMGPLWADPDSLAGLQARALFDAGKLSQLGSVRGGYRDGAACVILATRERALELGKKLDRRAAFIRGIDHRFESMQLGFRDLTVSESIKLAAKKARVSEHKIEVAELHGRYEHENVLVREALGLGSEVSLNPSGGCTASSVPMVSGLTRIGELAERILMKQAKCGVAHASSGPCLQQNLICVLEGG